MKIFFAGIFCAAAATLLAAAFVITSLQHVEDANKLHPNHVAQKWLLPRSAAAQAAVTTTVGSQPLAAPTVSPNWTIKHHGTCCEGNLAAQGPSTYVLLPILVNGNIIERSDDGGQTWVQKYPPLPVSQPYGIEGDLNAWGDDIVFFGTEVTDGVCAHSDDRGQNWTVVQIPVAFPANDQAWAYLGPFSNMRPGAPLPTDEPYVLAGWYRIGSVALFSFDGGLTWPIQTPLVGDDGSGPDHIVCQQTAHAPTSPGDTRIPDTNFINHKGGRHGTWGTDRKFYWTQTSNGDVGPPGNLYVCKTDNFGVTWTGIVHSIAAGPGSTDVVTYSGFDNNGTLYVLHGDKLYVSFNQGESFAFVHTLPRWANGEAADGANEFFVANCGIIHIGLIETGDAGSNNVWYLRGSHVDTASPTWDEELVDVVGNNRLDFMQIVINGNGIPTISYTTPGSEVTTASRNAPMPSAGDSCTHIIIDNFLSVVSRKTHGSAGNFDINFWFPPIASPRGVECRGSGSTNDYMLVFTFANSLTSVGSASVTSHDPASGTGAVCGSSMGPNPNQYTVQLCGVSTGQYITVTLNSVLDVTGATGNVVSPQMGFLVGDVNASGVVTSGDTNLCKAQALQTVTGANFRNDINASGAVTTGDVNIIKQNALSQLPTPP
jgi:hypothetical protein